MNPCYRECQKMMGFGRGFECSECPHKKPSAPSQSAITKDPTEISKRDAVAATSAPLDRAKYPWLAEWSDTEICQAATWWFMCQERYAKGETIPQGVFCLSARDLTDAEREYGLQIARELGLVAE